jgi:diguanylate cyclase (GGDEF)-like protein
MDIHHNLSKMPKRLLVIEDSRVITKILRRLLAKEEDIIPHFAATYAETVILCDEYDDFHGALVDLHLPDAPNGEALEYVLSQKIPTVVLTTEQSEEKRKRWFDSGVVDYVVKESRYSYEYALSVLQRLDINRKHKILVVDDSSTSRKLICNALSPHKFIIFEAENGRQGMDILRREQNIKLVLTDFNMPIMDGIQLAQEARRHFPRNRLSIIGLSSEGDRALSVKFIKHGANDFLYKPFATEELLCRVLHNLDVIHLIEKIEAEANQDYLTGLFNRRYLFREGELLLGQARQNNTPISVAIIDIYYFKRLNDGYGHDCGDAVLKIFSGYLVEKCADSMIARIGGEEFCLLMPGVEASKCNELLESIRTDMRDLPMSWHNELINVTFSAGVTDRIAVSLSTMISNADIELYRAKKFGRDRIQVAA